MIRTITFLALLLHCVQIYAMELAPVCKLIQESVCLPSTLTTTAFEALKERVRSTSTTQALELAAHINSGNSIGTAIAVLSLVGAVSAISFYAGIWSEGRDDSLLRATRRDLPALNYARVLLLCGSNPFARCDIDDEDDTEEADATDEDDDNQLAGAENIPFVFTRTLFNASTALHEAAVNGNRDLLALFLSKKRAQDDIDIQDSTGLTALHKACGSNLASTPHCIELLVAHGACVQAGDIHGNSPLQYAASYKSNYAIDSLLRLGVDVNACNYNGVTALQGAAIADYAAGIEILLRSGAQINAQDYKGNTALHYAANQGNRAALATLLQHGARADMRNAEQLTPYECAFFSGLADAAQMLTGHAQHAIFLGLGNEPKNPVLNKISRDGANIFTKLFNREIGYK